MKDIEIMPDKDMAYILQRLILNAKKSKCTRSKCGSVVCVPGSYIIGEGFNSQPGNCEGDCFKDNLPTGFKSDKTCCIHAEQRAITDALKSKPDQIKGSVIYFLRLDAQDQPMIAGAPYCTICSKFALDLGISRFVLLQKEGWTSYDSKYYNELSFQYNG